MDEADVAEVVWQLLDEKRPVGKRIDVIAESLFADDQRKIARAGGAIPIDAYQGEDTPESGRCDPWLNSLLRHRSAARDAVGWSIADLIFAQT